ncbi:MAG TPA: peptidoglycan-associated lipoprotein Pal [Methylomirabilota bacterium]|nr:peptidoglycan-associated lipoprotein Pal [Methylomirabilota bacterium]
MTRRRWQTTFTVLSLFVAAVMLSGCPKKPAPAAGTSPGSGAGPTVGAGGAGTGGAGSMAGGPGGAGAGTIGSGPGTGGAMGAGAAGGAGSMAGGTAATGTTIPALPSPKEFVETAALRDIFFDFDKYDIRPQDKVTLDDNARWLKSNTAALLLVEGHCDERGTNEYNLALGERRAKATRDYLVSAGIDGSRITVISYGKERPVCTERTEACWAKNRRSHFLVKQ